MRTNLKSAEYFKKTLEEREKSIYEVENKLASGAVPVHRIPDVRVYITDISFNILFLKYASGTSLFDLKDDYIKTVNLVHQSWDDRFIAVTGRKNKDDVIYILEAYYNMLFLLSMGLFLDADSSIYLKIKEVLDRNGVSDSIFNFLLSEKISVANGQNESYGQASFINNVYGNLKKAIRAEDKVESENYLVQHINGWYKGNKDAVWYNSHKSDLATFYGYWSFETAAVAKILGLEEASFCSSPHYPKIF